MTLRVARPPYSHWRRWMMGRTRTLAVGLSSLVAAGVIGGVTAVALTGGGQPSQGSSQVQHQVADTTGASATPSSSPAASPSPTAPATTAPAPAVTQAAVTHAGQAAPADDPTDGTDPTSDPTQGTDPTDDPTPTPTHRVPTFDAPPLSNPQPGGPPGGEPGDN